MFTLHEPSAHPDGMVCTMCNLPKTDMARIEELGDALHDAAMKLTGCSHPHGCLGCQAGFRIAQLAWLNRHRSRVEGA